MCSKSIYSPNQKNYFSICEPIIFTELHTRRCPDSPNTISVSSLAEGTSQRERHVWGQSSQCREDKLQAALLVSQVRHSRQAGGHPGPEGTTRCGPRQASGKGAHLSQGNKYPQTSCQFHTQGTLSQEEKV